MKYKGKGRKPSQRKPKIEHKNPVRSVYQDKDGYIYFFMNKREMAWLPKRSVKIGFSTNIEKRENQELRYFEPVLLGYFEGNMRQDEARLHIEFAKYHISGEWFQLSPEIMAYILENTRGHELFDVLPGEDS